MWKYFWWVFLLKILLFYILLLLWKYYMWSIHRLGEYTKVKLKATWNWISYSDLVDNLNQQVAGLCASQHVSTLLLNAHEVCTLLLFLSPEKETQVWVTNSANRKAEMSFKSKYLPSKVHSHGYQYILKHTK
jgi:hypothetical protein